LVIDSFEIGEMTKGCQGQRPRETTSAFLR